jgi:hypothetical protein
MNPVLLEGVPKGDHQDPRSRLIDEIPYPVRVRLSEITMVKAADPKSGDAFLQLRHCLFRDSRQTPKKEDPYVFGRRPITQLGNQVGSDQIVGESSSRQAAGQPNTGSIVQKQICFVEHPPKIGIGPG